MDVGLGPLESEDEEPNGKAVLILVLVDVGLGLLQSFSVNSREDWS